MGGEGSIQHMITSFRNNRKLLGRKSMFKKERSFMRAREEYYRASKGKILSKKLTKEELQLIRKEVIRKRRIEDSRDWSIVLVIVLLLVMLGNYAVQEFKQERIRHLEIKKENNLKEYRYCIEKGDTWMEKGNWENAIYQYEQAVDIFPDEFEGIYRLALACSYHCQYKGKDCDKGRILTSRLIRYFPDNEDLHSLHDIFTSKE